MTPAKGQDLKARREAGAAAIATRTRAIARGHGIGIEKCVWGIGEDVRHEYAHRLYLSTKTSTVRLYLPEAAPLLESQYRSVRKNNPRYPSR